MNDKASQEDVNPSEMFIAIVIKGIEEKKAMFLRKKGNVALDIEGDRSFTVRFGDSKEPVKEGVSEDADLTLSMGREILNKLVSGELDAGAELASGNLKVTGDIELLKKLFQLMEQGKNMLSLRAGL